jgi:hypothetical protein
VALGNVTRETGPRRPASAAARQLPRAILPHGSDRQPERQLLAALLGAGHHFEEDASGHVQDAEDDVNPCAGGRLNPVRQRCRVRVPARPLLDKQSSNYIELVFFRGDGPVPFVGFAHACGVISWRQVAAGGICDCKNIPNWIFLTSSIQGRVRNRERYGRVFPEPEQSSKAASPRRSPFPQGAIDRPGRPSQQATAPRARFLTACRSKFDWPARLLLKRQTRPRQCYIALATPIDYSAASMPALVRSDEICSP